MYEVKDKVVLVTGGAAGIGAGVVRAFLDEGAKHVAILDVDTARKVLEDELNGKYGTDKVKFYKCDVTTNDLNEAFDDILKFFGYIDVVVNNAGIMNDSPNVYEKEIAVNVVNSFDNKYNESLQPDEKKGGTIVNISSIIALYQSRVLPIYGATKSAVLQFSNGLGSEPHFSRTGVRVVTMCFGSTDTTLFSPNKLEAIDEETNELIRESLADLPWQTIESAVKGLIEAYKKGASASTWLVLANQPAKDITANVTKAYEIMSQGFKGLNAAVLSK